MLRLLRARDLLLLRVLQVLLLEDAEALLPLHPPPSPQTGHVRGQIEAVSLHTEAKSREGDHEGGLEPRRPRERQ